MAKNYGRIGIGIDFNVNTASLNQIKSALKSLQNMTKEQIGAAGGTIQKLSTMAVASDNNHLHEMRKELASLEKAFEAAFNPKLGTYELNKFNESLKESGTSAERAFAVVSAYGNQGKAALLDMTTSMLATDRAAKQVHSTFQKLGDTMMNTIRWSITSSAINMVTGAIQSAYHYAVDLDQSLNDIMIVTDKSAEEMERFARSANKAAKGLGASTRDYTDASLIYYQQGLNDADVKARTETTLKAAAITGQSADAVSEQLTAVWNGYKVSAEESELYIDKLSAVAATTAADLEELSTGMSKVASAANIMGVDVDQLNAQLATIVSVTREAPESVGTALKTVYARMSDIEAGLDTETTLGEYTAQMAQIGINVLDAQGNLRDMGAVVEEIGNKWSSLNREQRVSLAQSVAGTRQYSRMMALFDNWDMYQEALTTSVKSAGALSAQHATYLESIEAHQERLKASAEGLYDSIFDSDEIKGVYDTLSGIVTLVDELVQSMGGMPGILATVGMLFAKSAKHSIADIVSKQQANKLNNEIYRQQIQNGKELIAQQIKQIHGTDELDSHLKQVLDFEQKIYDNADNLTDDQWQILQEGVRKYNESIQKTIELEKNLQEAREDYNNTFSSGSAITFETYTDKEGNVKERHVKAERIGENEYWWGEEEDTVNQKGKKRAGLKTARNRRDQLEELKIERALTEAEEKELERLKRRIPIAERENKIRARKIALEQNHTNKLEKSQDATKKLRQETEDFLDKSLAGNKFATLIDNFTSISFSAIGVSSSLSSLTETMHNSDATFVDYIGGLGGLALSLTPLISHIDKARKKAIESGEAAKGAAAGWKAFKTAMGPVGWIMLTVTVLTSVASVLEKIREEAIKTAKESIEQEKQTQTEIQERKELYQAYLLEYEAYKKTRKASDEMISSAQKAVDVLKDQAVQAYLTRKEYENLANAIAAKNAEESGNELQSAKRMQGSSEDILDKVTVGSTKGIGWKLGFETAEDGSTYTTIDTNVISAGLSFDDEGPNKEILIKTLDKYATTTSSGQIKINWPKTSEEKVEFYNKLKQAVDTEGWVRTGSEIHKNVQKILNDEDYKTAVENYEASQDTINSASVAKNIFDKGFTPTDSTSLADFKTNRQKLIDELRAQDTTLDPTEASAIVDEQFAKLGGNATKLLAKNNFLKAWTEEGQIFEGQDEELTKVIDSLDESEFDALNLLDIEEFEGDAEKLKEAAIQKAKEVRDEAWALQKDARLVASENEIERLEKAANKEVGQKKVDLIQQQNKELGKQIELLKKVDLQVVATNKTTAQQDFKKLAEKYGFVNGLKVGEDENWDIDTIRLAIEEDKGLSADQKTALEQELFNNVLKSQNEYATQLEEIVQKEEQIHENKIAAYQIEIEAIETIREKYETLIGTLQSISSLYKTMYGENEFSKLTGLYNDMLEIANKNVRDSRDKIQTLQSQLKDNTLSPAAKEELTKQLNAAFGEAVSAAENRLTLIREAFTNSINAVFQTSAAQATGGKSLDYINKDWEYRVEASERYLDSMSKTYRIETLEKNTLERINKLTNTKTQERINDVLNQQLKVLRERDKLTEADVERAERKIKLLEAEIALEQARENRSQMRLVRGADGAYSYQYVADQSAIRAAEKEQQALVEEDRLATKQEYQESVSEWSDTYSRYLEELSAAGNDKNLIARTNEYYEDLLSEIVDRNQRLLQEYQTLDANANTNSAAQIWINQLAANENKGLASLLESVAATSTSKDYSSALNTTNTTLEYIYQAMRRFADKENIELDPLPKETSSFDTGGYTGSWGPEPKVLLAHEKELILKPSDTSNILNAVELVRHLNDSMFNSIAKMDLSFDPSLNGLEAAREMIVEQEVYITAEFPNATDRTEIEAAFDELIGLATQHASKNVYGK